MKILITGFEPFLGEEINPSFEAVKRLPDRIESAILIKKQMPVEYDRCKEQIREWMRTESPDVVICVGQAGGRMGITPEYVAINWVDSEKPDNAGKIVEEEPVRPDGPAAYFSNLPVKNMVREMKKRGIPAQLSYSAGTYVCNCLMYELLYQIEHYDRKIKGGFIHIPYECKQVAKKENIFPSLSLSVAVEGLITCIQTLL